MTNDPEALDQRTADAQRRPPGYENHRFVGHCVSIDRLISRLIEHRRRHFGVDARTERRTWDDVDRVEATHNALFRIVDALDRSEAPRYPS